MRNNLLRLYLELEAYPEVISVLQKLNDKGVKTGILSNGTKKMLRSAVISAGIENLLNEIISVEECKVFKPSRKTYELVETKMKVNKEQVMYISSNAWDMHAAADFGFDAVWVNRYDGKLEKLPGKPKLIINNLSQIISKIKY